MYCPKCAAKNEDNVTFCRACGDDIGIVVQSLKGYSLLALTSKIDKAFGLNNERLIGNSILFFLLGIAETALFTWQIWSGNLPNNFYLFLELIWILLGFLGGGYSLWAYKISSTPASKIPASNSVQNHIYCPACGELNEKTTDLCKKCGKDLEEVSKVMTQHPSGWLNQGLHKILHRNIRKEAIDAHLAKEFVFLGFKIPVSSDPEKGYITFLFLTVANSIFILFLWVWLSLIPLFLIPVSVLFLILGGWEYVSGKRLKLILDEINSEAETAKLESPTKRQLTSVKAKNEINHFSEAETQRELQNLKNKESETKKLK